MAPQFIFTTHRLGRFHPPDRTVLEGISLSYYPGAKIGVIGPNGSGKSSLLRIMAGLDSAHLGEARPAEGIHIGFLPREPLLEIIENRPHHDQLWYARGWASKTGYDPAGLGIGGFGNLAGFTLDQVKEVPLLSAKELLEYFDQVYEALRGYLEGMELEVLEEPPAGWPGGLGSSAPEDIYVVLMMFLLDNREHLGEIKAIVAMWYRAVEKALPKNTQ